MMWRGGGPIHVQGLVNSPAPSPTPDPARTVLVFGTELVIGLALVVVATFLLVWLLLRVARYEPQAMLTTTIALVTILTIGAYVLTREQTLGTLAATGVGALAGALTTVWESKRQAAAQAPPDTPPDDPANPD